MTTLIDADARSSIGVALDGARGLALQKRDCHPPSSTAAAGTWMRRTAQLGVKTDGREAQRRDAVGRGGLLPTAEGTAFRITSTNRRSRAA